MKINFSRAKILSIFILVFGLLLVTKLFWVQVVDGNAYRENANRQYATPASNIFERGTIFFKNKNGDLTRAGTQISGFKVAVTPTLINDIDLYYQEISAVIDLDRDDFYNKAKRKEDPYEEIATRITKIQADKINSLSLPGVAVFKEKWRVYPGGSMASHALGFVGFSGDELAGRYGLEKKFNTTLSLPTDTLYVNFFAEVFSNIEQIFSSESKGGDIVTTIDPEVQMFLEKTLNQVSTDRTTDSIGGIIINPQDGSIYAIASKPDFDPNTFSQTKNISFFSNPWTENVFEFGSIIKPLIMVAAIDKGVITADTKYNDTGSVVIEKKEIFNFDKKGRGPNTTMQDVLSQSLNTGMVLVYNKLGKDSMREYLYSYGVKEKTGIDLPNETNNLVKNLESPREIEYANASFGQGIALTPISMARALSVIANDGNLPTPHVVEKILYNDGTEKSFEYPTAPTKLKKESTEEITRMLVNVLDKSLQEGKAKLPHHSIAVKTGTAQVANPSGGGYYVDRHTHSFFGYFPAYNPKFLVLLYAVNPKGVLYASQTWTNPFMDITKFLLNYYEVPPDR